MSVEGKIPCVHLYKWRNQFSDVIFFDINDETVNYAVVSKDTGIRQEPPRTSKYFVDEINKMVYIDERSMTLIEFLYAKGVINS